MARQIQRWGYQYEGVDENGRPVGECIAVRDKNGQWVQWSDVATMLEESRKTVRSAVQQRKAEITLCHLKGVVCGFQYTSKALHCGSSRRCDKATSAVA